MPNWLDGERRDRLKVQCVNPLTFSYLGSFSVTGATLTEGYYTDTRIQGTVSTIDAAKYIPLSMIRLIHEADFQNGDHYKQILGTFFAIRSRDTWRSGSQTTEFELKSVLYGLSNDLAPYTGTLAKGSMAQAAFNDLCYTHCSRKCRWIAGANDKRFDKNRTLEIGDSRLSWLHQLADMSDNRLNCDEEGYVIMTKYISPSKITPKMSLPYNSPLVLASGIGRTSDEMTVSSRSIVTWEHEYEVKVKDGTYSSACTDSDGVYHPKGSTKYKTKRERKPIIAYADVDAGDPAHINRRGFRIASWHQEDDLGDSQALAQQAAKAYLGFESKPTVEWSVSTRWFEVHPGDVLRWKPSADEDYRKVLVTDCDKDLFKFTIQLKLKEV